MCTAIVIENIKGKKREGRVVRRSRRRGVA